jgi:hypothetical protein
MISGPPPSSVPETILLKLDLAALPRELAAGAIHGDAAVATAPACDVVPLADSPAHGDLCFFFFGLGDYKGGMERGRGGDVPG